MVSAQGGKIINLTNSGYTSGSPRWVLDGNAILFITERYGMRAHASWGSLNDVMLVFMNQDAYDKFRLSKEDYELQKELEKEQKNTTEAKKNDKKKGDNKENPKRRKRKSKGHCGGTEQHRGPHRTPYSQLFRFGERHYHQRRRDLILPLCL